MIPENEVINLRIEDVFQEPFTNGLLYNLVKVGSLGYILEDIMNNSMSNLDMEYVYNRSGKKKVSGLVAHLLSKSTIFVNGFPQLGTDDYVLIGDILRNRFGTKWLKARETIKYDFDPLTPYDMSIHENVQDTLSSTKNTSGTRNNKSDYEENTSTEEHVDGNSVNNVFGFNSADEVGDSTSQTNDNSSRTSSNNTETSQNEERESQEIYSRENPIIRDLTRKGNIGNITKQQLIEQQRELLQWQFFNIVFDDIDSVLTRGMF